MIQVQIPLFLVAAACQPPPAAPVAHAPDVGHAIVNGNFRGGNPRVTFGAGKTDAGCTVTMLESNVGLTSRSCASMSKDVGIGGRRVTIERVRDVVDDSRDVSGNVVSVQLDGDLPLASDPFSRRVDRTPLQPGEVVQCFGFGGGSLTDGSFTVDDGDPSVHVSLRGNVNTSFLPFEVGPGDLGGFCQRDGSFDVVAILTVPTVGDIAGAEPLWDLGRGVDGAVAAADASVAGVAIRLVDANTDQRFTTELWTEDLTFDTPTANELFQAFYRDVIHTWPGGNPVLLRLVDAATGECVTDAGGGQLALRPCDASGSQSFVEDYIGSAPYEEGRYSYKLGGDAITVNGSTLELQPWSDVPEQRFQMWLTSY